jgi:hypothetical protein
LNKELRMLLNSEIIKGKVAVQRAYADWRRYPQYIVPLSESSIDLIFAPAFGTNKKNATDIRLAVDAVELIFTRPEIGTFILLSGDSDFSSLVLKLKEYGKYVIGVGIKESASDILIQNCDEYFSYSDLAGLAKESDEASPARDPWELVAEAVQKMAATNDVMRSDRLKQVMQQMDPSFDERNVGHNRFSKFVTEAGTRGLIRVIKQENGQFEVAPLAAGTPAAPAGRAPSSRPAPRGRAPAAAPAAAAVVAPAAPAAGDTEERAGRRRRGRGRGRGKGAAIEGGEATLSAPVSRPALPQGGLTLAEAFHLLARALGELPVPASGETLRARMAVLHGKEDSLLDTARFAKLLRQANDAEVADVRMVGEDQYEVSPHKADLALQKQVRATAAAAAAEPVNGETPAAPAPRQPAALRFRGGSRTATRPGDVPMFGVVELTPSVAPVALPAPTAVVAPAAEDAGVDETAAKKPARGRGRAAPKAPAAKSEAVVAKPAAKAAAAPKSTKKAAPKGKKASPKSSKPRVG